VSVVRTVEVPVDPATAFAVFTDEIDAWYERGRYSWNVPEHAVGIRFEGGRLLELHDDGDAYEMGRVTAWEPGERLVFVYRSVHLPSELRTEVEIRFEPVGDGTRVRETYDWSTAMLGTRLYISATGWPKRAEKAMTHTLERLDARVTKPADQDGA
jgi:uncharacterized protein YndB with AHSA1/START domain